VPGRTVAGVGLRSLVCLGAITAFVVTSASAEARQPRPPGALATITYPNGHPNNGYGSAEACPSCEFDNWAHPAPYELADSGDGRLLVAQTYDYSTLQLDTYDPATYRRVARRRTTFTGWRIGGVLLAADRSVYVLLGRTNWDESKSKVVIQVRKLDRNLVSGGVAGVKGGFDGYGIYDPFEATDSSMALVGGTLIVHTARLILHIAGDSAPHHQGDLSFAVDTGPMTIREIDGPNARHSFRQFIRPHGLDAVFLDHADGYPRALQVAIVGGLFGPPPVIPDCPQTGDPTPAPPGCEIEQPRPRSDRFKAMTFPGRVGANYTGATVNGFEVGTTNALTVGLSVSRRHKFPSVLYGPLVVGVRNAYVISTDLTNGKSRFAWLTTYPGTTKRSAVSQPQLVPVGPDRFAALFGTQVGTHATLRYILFDQTGAVVARKRWPGRRFAALAQPALVGTKLLWVGYWRRPPLPRYRTGDFLYGVDLRDPAKPRLLTR
jgi:hypothetical protein